MALPIIAQPTTALPEPSKKLLAALQQGAVLHWSPTTGYLVTLPNGTVRRCRWFVAAALRTVGLIQTDDHRWHGARLWYLTATDEEHTR